MRIAVHGKEFSSELRPFVMSLFDYLKNRNVELLLSDKFNDILKNNNISTDAKGVFSHKNTFSNADVLITLGGDGTLLEAVTYIAEKNTPILGINTGRLGFLATTAIESVETALDHLFKKDYTYDNRAMLHLETNNALFSQTPYALNDFTILKKDSSSMIAVTVYIDGAFLNTYWADGLIVSTPTGSTGYSLSCGGPLVLPRSKNFVITPVSPHNLTARPMVVSDDVEITFKIEGRNDSFLISLDSRVESIDSSVDLTITKESFGVRLIQLPFYSYFDTLRQKLNWGVDVRN